MDNVLKLTDLKKPEALRKLEEKSKVHNEYAEKIANYAYYIEQEEKNHKYSKILKKHLDSRGIKEKPNIIMRLFDSDFIILNKFMTLVEEIDHGMKFNFPNHEKIISCDNIRSLYPELFEFLGEKIVENIFNYTKKGVGQGELLFKLFTKNVMGCTKGDVCYIDSNGNLIIHEIKSHGGNVNPYNIPKAEIINTKFKKYCQDNKINYGKLPELGIFSSMGAVSETFNYIIIHNSQIKNITNTIVNLLKISFVAQYKELIDKQQEDFIKGYINHYAERLIVNNSIDSKLVHYLLSGSEIYLYQKVDKWDNLICFQELDKVNCKRKKNPDFNYGVIKKEDIDNPKGLQKFTDDAISGKNGFSFSSGPHVKNGMDVTVKISYKSI